MHLSSSVSGGQRKRAGCNRSEMTEKNDPASGEKTAHRLRNLPVMIFVQLSVAAAGLVVEILASRMLAPYVGMSLYTWTAVIAVVLAGFSAGHWAGGYIAQKSSDKALAHTALAMALGALSTAVTLVLLRAVAGGILSSVGNAAGAILVLACVIAFLPSFFAGIPSPVLARTAVALRPGREGTALGAVFAASSLGAIVGTLATGFIFIAWLGTALTILVVVVTYVVLAALLAVAAGGGNTRLATGLISAAAIAISLYTLTAAKACTAESRYYCVRIIDFSRQAGAEAKLMVLDHLGHGINVRDNPERLITPYVALMDTLLTKRLGGKPASSFFIGGGAYTLPRAWKVTAPAARITVAEIDPVVTQLARAQMWLPARGIEILHKDARVALAEFDRHYEVIVGDAFTDIAVPPHLVTLEFFELVKARLTANGIYAMNVVDHVGDMDALFAVYATMKAVFESVEVFAEKADLVSGGRTTFVLFASAQDSGIVQAVNPKDHDQLFVRLSQDRLAARVAEAGTVLLTDDFAPIDRLVGIGEL